MYAIRSYYALPLLLAEDEESHPLEKAFDDRKPISNIVDEFIKAECWPAFISREEIEADVITSYSIHYTKLYESANFLRPLAPTSPGLLAKGRPPLAPMAPSRALMM